MDETDCTSEMDTTAIMDRVVRQIYASCDPDNTNSVPVSLLINFVKPYMSNNLAELQGLQCQLDPDNSNPTVSSEVFYKAMSEWTARVKESTDTFSTDIAVDEEVFGVGHSTPRPSVGYSEFVKNCSEILNMSNISVYESENSVGGADKTALEEHVDQLEHQIKKTMEELDAVKQQLVLAEEQNETLATDLKVITKQLHREQQITDQLKQSQQENQEITDELYNARKKIVQLEKALANGEKDRQNLLAEITQLEIKKSTLEGKLESIQQQEQDAKMLIISMQQEIQVKDSEISTLMTIMNELKGKLEDKEELIAFYKNENELAQHKTNNLKKLLEEQQNSKTDRFLEKIIGDKELNTSSESEASCDMDYNSPRLLDQIAHPVSPPETNIVKKLTPPKRAAMDLRKLVLIKNTSTPFYADISNISPEQRNGFGEGHLPNLQEELSEISSVYYSARSSPESFEQGSEDNASKGTKESDKKMDNLLQLITNQEYDKRDLWTTIKELMSEIEVLKNYRKDYKELEEHLIVKNNLVKDLCVKIGKDLSKEHQENVIQNVEKQLKFEDKYLQVEREKKELIEENQDLKLKLESAKRSKHESDLNSSKIQTANNLLENKLRVVKEECSDLVIRCKNFEEKCDFVTQFEDSAIKESEDKVEVLADENLKLKIEIEQLHADRKLLEKNYEEKMETLRKKCFNMEELEEKCVFLSQFKDSFDNMLEENETIREDCERVINQIVDNLEPHLKPSDEQRSPNLTFSIGDFTKIVNKLEDLLDLVVNHMKSDENKARIEIGDVCHNCGLLKPPSTSVSFDPKKMSFGKQELKIERLQAKMEQMQLEIAKKETKISTLSSENASFKCDQLKLLDDYELFKFKCGKLEKQIKDLKIEHDQELEAIRMKCLEESAFIDHENRFLKEELTSLKENLDLANHRREVEQENYSKVCTDFVNNIERINSELKMEQSLVGALEQNNGQLAKKIRYLEGQLREEESQNCVLRKKNVDLLPINNPSFLQLENSLREKNVVIGDLEKQLDALKHNEKILEDVHKFMINNCNDLERSTSVITNCKDLFTGENEMSCNLLKLLHQMKTSDTRFSTDIEREMFKLSNQINLAITLLEIVTKKCSNLVDVLDERSMTSDTGNSSGSLPEGHISASSRFDTSENDNSFKCLNDTFQSCYSELCSIDEDDSDISHQKTFPSQCGGFLESLNLDPESPRMVMSKEVMEEKFTTLALNFTVDFSTSKIRYEKQNRRCQYYLSKFNLYLESAIKLLKSKSGLIRKSDEVKFLLDVASYLELVSDMVSILLDSSKQCGVLKCEVDTMKCWNFVTNYVAILRQDRNASQTNLDNVVNKEPDEGLVMQNSTCSTTRFLKTATIFMFAFLTLSFVFVVVPFVLYVQSECSKFGKTATCPVDWAFDQFMDVQRSHKRTY